MNSTWQRIIDGLFGQCAFDSYAWCNHPYILQSLLYTFVLVCGLFVLRKDPRAIVQQKNNLTSNV